VTVITILGAGVMGTALGFPASDNGHEVRLVGTDHDAEIIEACQKGRLHPRLHRALPAGVTPFFNGDLPTAMAGAEIVVVGVSSRGVHWAAEQLSPYIRPGHILLMVTKGMESTADGRLQLLPDVLRERLPAAVRDQVHYACIGGPSIAGELAGRRPTAVVFASREASILPRLQAIFSTPYYHIWTSTDLVGVEVCVAMKNPYALAVGLAAGVLERVEKYTPDAAGAGMHNYGAAVFAQGLAETAQLVQALGGGLETVFSLPGAGDLYVTTQGGRNARMGRLLGLGLPYSEAVEEMPNETVEGVDAVLAMMPAIEAMTQRGELPPDALPLLRELHRIVTRSTAIDFDFEAFFSRLSLTPPKRQRMES